MVADGAASTDGLSLCSTALMADDEIRPFRIDVPAQVLDDLRDRLARTRWPDQIPDTGWDYGTDRAFLQRLCEHWRTEFDWRTAEARLNRYPQFTTAIDGQRIHFLHVRSPHPEAMPLVITHGWPGSVWEFMKVIDPLVDPVAHGGRAEDAFHIVAPSLPGYGWSGPTGDRGWDVWRIAETWAALMARLGYERYGAQGGDWGAVVSHNLALVDPSHLAGIHLNMVIARPPAGDERFAGVTAEEMEDLAPMAEFRTHGVGYQEIQGTKPQTLAYGLTDSPAGLAGWIVEKFRAWSDCGGDLESRFTLDELLANLTIYWVTGTIGSACRLYYETRHAGRRLGIDSPRAEVPTGVAVFPGEMAKPPRVWAERLLNITHWQRYPSGGHFAAMEEPELLVGDIRAFFATVR